jgi:hypothetical protein
MKYTLLVEVDCNETLDEIEAMLAQEQEKGSPFGERMVLRSSIKEIALKLAAHSHLVDMHSQMRTLTGTLDRLKQSNENLREALEMSKEILNAR